MTSGWRAVGNHGLAEVAGRSVIPPAKPGRQPSPSPRQGMYPPTKGDPHLPRGVRAAQAQGMITPTGLASSRQMSKSPSRRFPVIVTQLPVTRCQICHRTVAYRPGSLSEVLTGHYRRAHPEALGVPSQ